MINNYLINSNIVMNYYLLLLLLARGFRGFLLLLLDNHCGFGGRVLINLLRTESRKPTSKLCLKPKVASKRLKHNKMLYKIDGNVRE